MSNKPINEDEESDLSQERDDRCEVLASKSLAIIGSVDGVYLGNSAEEKVAHYNPILKRLMELYKNEDARLSEITYVHQIIMEAISHLQNYTNASIQKHSAKIQEGFYGKPPEEVTMADIAEKLEEIESKE